MIVVAVHGVAALLIVGALVLMGGSVSNGLPSIAIAVVGAVVSCALWLAVVDSVRRAR